MDEEELKRFTPTELILYKHAQEYRYMSYSYQFIPVYTIYTGTKHVHTSTYQYIRVYTGTYLYIPLSIFNTDVYIHRWTAEKGHG